jgi:hypothetical protein
LIGKESTKVSEAVLKGFMYSVGENRKIYASTEFRYENLTSEKFRRMWAVMVLAT